MNRLELAEKVRRINFDDVTDLLLEIQSFRAWTWAVPPALDQHDVPWGHNTVEKYGWGQAVRERGLEEGADMLTVQVFCREVYRVLGWKLHEVLKPVMNEIEHRGDGRGVKRRVLTSVRKSVLVRDDATCQLCGLRWELPLSVYRQLKDEMRSRLAPDSSTTEEDRKLNRANFNMAKGPEMDHIIPATFGGPSDPWNLWTLCHACNQRIMADLWPPAIELALERLRRRDPYMRSSVDEKYDPGRVPRG